MSDRKWDKAIILLAVRLTNISIVHDTPMLRDKHIARALRERLVPLLDAAEKVTSNECRCGHDPDNCSFCSGAVRLEEEVEKWRNK